VPVRDATYQPLDIAAAAIARTQQNGASQAALAVVGKLTSSESWRVPTCEDSRSDCGVQESEANEPVGRPAPRRQEHDHALDPFLGALLGVTAPPQGTDAGRKRHGKADPQKARPMRIALIREVRSPPHAESEAHDRGDGRSAQL
jgi:hypothetical protein